MTGACTLCHEDGSLRPFFGGVCGECLGWIKSEFEELACDRATNLDPLTGEKRTKDEWKREAFRMRDSRNKAEDLVNSWRELELGTTAAYILSEEREDYLGLRIRRFNERPHRRKARPYERRNNSFPAPWNRDANGNGEMPVEEAP